MFSKRVVGILTVLIAIAILSLLASPKFGYPGEARFGGKPDGSKAGRVHRGSPHQVTDRTFLLLKTGSDVANNRLPAHFDTTFNIYPHHAVYAETNETINGQPMIDALSFLGTEILNDPGLEAYRVRQQSLVDNWHWNGEKLDIANGGGWELDRFKNVPAFADAWLKNPTYDWYVMIDADSYFPASTLAEVTRGKNPDQPCYLGKGVGNGIVNFAHGGSGIILSRGALRGMFGDSMATAEQTVKESGEYVINQCCGDLATSYIFENKTGRPSSDSLQFNEFGQFQGNPFDCAQVRFTEYCNPVGTFHVLPSWQINKLYKWEVSKGDKTIYYADYYHDFILPEISEEKPNWFLTLTRPQMNTDVYDVPHPTTKSKVECKAACVADETCTMWQFLGGDKCIISRQSVSQGKAMNKFSKDWNPEWTEATAGFMVERIEKFRKSQLCDRVSNRTEGYAYKYREPGSITLSSHPLPRSRFEEPPKPDAHGGPGKPQPHH